MNWMRVSLRKWAWKTVVLGIAAGLWAVFAAESALIVLERLGAGAEWQVLAAGLALGLTSGALLARIGEGLHHYPRRTWAATGWGALYGAIAGLAGIGAVSWWIAPYATPQRLLFGVKAIHLYAGILPFLLAALGAAIGFGSGCAVRNLPLSLRRLRGGLVGGLVAGGLVGAGVFFFPRNFWVQSAALVAWAAVLAQVLFWSEKRFARRWLRVLTGPGEDECIPLVNRTIHVGKLESNEIPLLHYSEVYPVHCRIDWVQDQYKIIDDETGGTVYVNFRQVQEQPLKPGDLVKIGSALLQYGEAS
jgi:hypothetical protein